MRDAAKRSTAGPTVRQAIGLGRTLRGALACLLALVAFCGIGASSAFAQEAPVVTVTGSSEVGVTSARLEGEVNPEGEAGSPSTFFHFEVSADNGAGEPDGNWIFVNGNPDGEISGPEAEEANPVAVEGIAEGLAPNTTYFIRLAADNAEFANHAETTAPFPSFETEAATEPTLATTATDAIGFSSATLHGTVDPEGGNVNPIGGPLAINWELQYREAGVFGPGEGWAFGGGGEVSGAEAEESTPIAVQAELPPGSLQAGQSYEVRLFAYYLSFSRSAESPEPFESFETEAATAPTVSVEDVSSIGTTSAQFSGHVELANSDPAFNAECHFEYVSEAKFTKAEWAEASSIACSPDPVEGAGSTEVSAEPTDLLPGTTYHLRLSASNQGGSDEAIAANTFTTEPAAPALGHTFVSDVGPSAATLNAEVDPSGAPTTVHFEYLSAAAFEASGFASATSTPESASLGEDNTEHLAQARIEGLDADTRYAYRAIATNSVESVPGEAHFFHTEAIQSEEADSCPNAARRAEQHSSFLPDCRAYEMVSPPDKNGGEVVGMSSRTYAAAGESPGLPAAVAFASLQGFGDAHGTGVASDYLAQRTAAAGTQGWSTHGITPQQSPTTLLEAIEGLESLYTGYMSADLTKGVFFASTPLTEAENVERVPNLYRRDDLRIPGEGSYRLLSDASSPLPAPVFAQDPRELVAGTSDDFQHVLFESRQNLTPDASGTNAKLYKTDGENVRLMSSEPACPGGKRVDAPCSAAGKGMLAHHDTQRTLSSDGSRAIFMSPTTPSGNELETPGAASKLFQLDDRGTAVTADDAIIQINASETSSPGPTRAATFETASTDGNRVFFLSAEQLLDGASGGLYMWERQENNETQSLTVDATGGTFTLTAHSQPSAGSGTLTEGSATVEGVEGSFEVGQAISAAGIPPGTTIAEIPSSQELTLSAPATASEAAQLSASIDATTAPLPFDASAQQVQEALEGLDNVGEGNVSITGGPGGTAPYSVTFTGALAGVDVMPLSADDGALSGGGASASVATSTPVRNLSLIAPTSVNPAGAGAVGASADGHRLYFATDGGQLVSGGPPVSPTAIYYWQDADGSPGGTLSFVGGIASGDLATNIGNSGWNGSPSTARVTPDGLYLAFEVSDGSGLKPRYDQTQCNPGVHGNPNGTGQTCSEVYLYRADTSSPTVPDLVCASCNPTGAPATAGGGAWLDFNSGGGAADVTPHLSHAFSDDGRHVFFSIEEALVPEDTNGKFDAYEYDTQSGRIHLLSSGTDPSPSFFMDASDDGSDVYIATRQQLVGWDSDRAYDLYDARVEGGFAEPPITTAPCNGESCRGGVAAAPAAPALGSGREGLGNPKPRRRCPKGRRVLRRHGKARCVKARHHRKRHRSHHRRHARPDRRTAR